MVVLSSAGALLLLLARALRRRCPTVRPPPGTRRRRTCEAALGVLAIAAALLLLLRTWWTGQGGPRPRNHDAGIAMPGTSALLEHVRDHRALAEQRRPENVIDSLHVSAAPDAVIPDVGVGTADRPLLRTMLQRLRMTPKSVHRRGIALCFLVRDSLPLAALWDAFLDGEGANFVPFSLHVHAAMIERAGDFSPRPSRYADALLPFRVEGSWGTFEIVRAEKLLLAAALLRDVSASHFVLASESCIPLYSIVTLARALFADKAARLGFNESTHPSAPGAFSRVASGEPEPRWRNDLNFISFKRFAEEEEENARIRQDPSARLEVGSLRKAPQWKVLHVSHARTVVDDVVVYNFFHRHCWNVTNKPLRGPEMCCCDETYVPTLLAHLQLEHEVVVHHPSTAVTWTKWRGTRWGTTPHPEEYKAADAALFRRIRSGGAACASALSAESSPPAVPSSCPLFARKFLPSSAASVLALGPAWLSEGAAPNASGA